MVFFPQVSPPKPCTLLSPPLYAPHAPPISFFLILSLAQYWVSYNFLKLHDIVVRNYTSVTVNYSYYRSSLKQRIFETVVLDDWHIDLWSLLSSFFPEPLFFFNFLPGLSSLFWCSPVPDCHYLGVLSIFFQAKLCSCFCCICIDEF